ncbi:unnamed protein product [Phytophthora fragariaefolia]|uniref:Unnamed protein product n=1 Tax=Phytophthora fragariaefolia TaxID=1490495 RepID=A0A9W6XQY9_9STRA|nr:unnamed protein product [Phytophthora fragariaefolia]
MLVTLGASPGHPDLASEAAQRSEWLLIETPPEDRPRNSRVDRPSPEEVAESVGADVGDACWKHSSSFSVDSNGGASGNIGGPEVWS